jgi:hypothetical protein
VVGPLLGNVEASAPEIAGFEGAAYLRVTDEIGLVVLEDLCQGTRRGFEESLRSRLGRKVLFARGARSGAAEVAFDAQRGAEVEVLTAR